MSRCDPPAGVPNVLVVDDDQALRGLFTTLLTRKGFAVDTATDGRVAYDQLQRHTYSVILLDLMMPEVNGFEPPDKPHREAPPLLGRGIVMAGASQRSIEALDTTRIWGLIRKPFDIDQLVSSALACSQGRRNRGGACFIIPPPP